MSMHVENKKSGLNVVKYSLTVAFPDVFDGKNNLELGVSKPLSVSLVPTSKRVIREGDASQIVFDVEVTAPYAEISPAWYASIPLINGLASDKLNFGIVPTDEQFNFVEVSIFLA
jgi:hypothetical protein